jgi:multidrug efflux pump subunit AcrA (membrane-fusion protein)
MTAPATLELNKSVFKFGSTPSERADESAREQLRQAEKDAQEAAQRVEAERAALEERQTRLEHQTAKVSQLRVRLRAVESHGFAKQLSECEAIFDRLFCSPALSEPNNRITLNSATAALGWIPKAQERQAKLIVRLKGELVEAEKELANLEK